MTDEPDIIPSDMRAELEKFNGLATETIESFISPLEERTPPPIIYHYTSDAGLRGILESGTLWLTDIFNLNDPSELSHGLSHAVKILDSMAASGPLESKLFTEQLGAFVTQGGVQAAAHFFVCSFSADGDDLGQWRAYADNGCGYVLGFDARCLENGYTKPGSDPIPNNSTFPVTDDDTQLTALHRKMIQAAFPLISLPRGKGLDSATVRAYMQELSVLVSMHALRAALFFKHEGYRNEQEYRFLQLHQADRPPAVKFRSRPYSLVKYREFDWRTVAPEALTQIVIGPAAAPDKAFQFARECVSSFHFENVQIVHSEIPYRVT